MLCCFPCVKAMLHDGLVGCFLVVKSCSMIDINAFHLEVFFVYKFTGLCM